MTFILALLMMLAASGGNTLAQSQRSYDGLWWVSFKVHQGSCREREIEVVIRNSEITHAGDRGFFSADGRVEAGGRVEVNIGALGMTASAEGQLVEAHGRGVWEFPEFGCSGPWVAERRST
jgi:hypothetical protein